MQSTAINHHQPTKIFRIYTAGACLVAWFALILQFGLSVPAYMRQGHSALWAFVQIVSFFTIQSNILAGISLWAATFNSTGWLGQFFKRASTVSAIVLYISIVGLVYHTILKGLWHPQGWPKVADELLHTADPLLFIAYWAMLPARQKLPWRLVLNWLWFPLVYLVYTLVRGALAGVYPYPFIDAGKLGYQKITINALAMLAAFVLVGLLVVGISRLLSHKRRG